VAERTRGLDRDDNTPPFDDVLSVEEEEIVLRLSATDVETIDAAILAVANERWRKVAFIVSRLCSMNASGGMNASEPGTVIIPFRFYVRRVAMLAERGMLESQGDLRRMIYSEVRLPQGRARVLS
jgi:hypothetical protein